MTFSNTQSPRLPTREGGDSTTMPCWAELTAPDGNVANRSDSGDSVLAEVDFKWLMAGQGWWIDPHRMTNEPSYAAELIRFGLASATFALRESAALMQTQMGDAVNPCQRTYAKNIHHHMQ